MAQNTALINGQEFSFVDWSVQIGGVEIFGCTNIVATETQEKTNNYGLGAKPTSRGRGKKEYEVTFDMELKDKRRIATALSASGSLNDVPAVPVVILGDNGVNKHRITLTAFEFSSSGVEVAEDDTRTSRSYPGICADIVEENLA
jgi:hypothetical protein